MFPPPRINIIGSGNLAWTFCEKWIENGLPIGSVYSKTPAHREDFSKAFSIEAKTSLAEIILDCEILLLAVNDDAIQNILVELDHKFNGTIIYCSGSIGLEIFAGLSYKRYACVWPLISLTKKVMTDQNFPLIITSSDKNTETAIESFTNAISSNKIFLGEDQKKQLHLAAVIANNFTNALWVEAFKILTKNNISTELLIPIIQNAVEKLKTISPLVSQTGPAKRNDKTVMENQIRLLADDPKLQEIYKALSNRIQHQHGKL